VFKYQRFERMGAYNVSKFYLSNPVPKRAYLSPQTQADAHKDKLTPTTLLNDRQESIKKLRNQRFLSLVASR